MEAQRVLVYGVTGSGKSTLARRLGEITGLPYVSVDDLVWRPGWEQKPKRRQRKIMTKVCAEDAWILDHAYGKWFDIVLERAELIIVLDYPRWVSVSRLALRTLGRVILRTKTCNGNVQTLRSVLSDESVFHWHSRTYGWKKWRVRTWAEDDNAPAMLIFERPSQTRQWLRSQRVGAVRVATAERLGATVISRPDHRPDALLADA